MDIYSFTTGGLYFWENWINQKNIHLFPVNFLYDKIRQGFVVYLSVDRLEPGCR